MSASHIQHAVFLISYKVKVWHKKVLLGGGRAQWELRFIGGLTVENGPAGGGVTAAKKLKNNLFKKVCFRPTVYVKS